MIDNNYKLFSLIFKNNYLRNLIYHHVKIYQKYNNFNVFLSINQLINHPYRTYITDLLYTIDEPLSPNIIPTSVTSLQMFDYNYQIKPNDIPNSVISLYLFSDTWDKSIMKDTLPQSITHITMCSDLPIYDQDIPNSVTSFHARGFNQNSLKKLIIPSSIKKLSLYLYDSPILAGDFNSTTITDLHLGYYFNSRIEPLSIPPSVKKLRFSESFNQQILPHSLPDSIEKMIFFDEFCQVILPNSIPSKIKKLAFGTKFKEIDWSVIPESCESIVFYNKDIIQNIPQDILSSKLKIYYISDLINKK